MINPVRRMNLDLLKHLLRLRYRLLWAHARVRNGKLALAAALYLLLCPAIAVMALGGLGAAVASIQAGRAEWIVGILLTLCFLSAAMAAVVLGAGMRSVFSDAALRRYPLAAPERFIARHLESCLEPLWLLVLALYLGVAAGFSLYGGAAAWMALPAALLLACSNYLVARILSILVERILAARCGPFLLLGAVSLLITLPAYSGLLLQSGQGRGAQSLLRLLPSCAAAVCITGEASRAAAGWMLYLLGGCGALAAVLWWLDRLPAPSRTVADAPAAWHGAYDRIAAVFGADAAPLAGKILRYYARSPHLRFNYPAAPLLMLMAILDAERSFVLAIGIIGIVGFLSMGSMTMNMFGFDGAGFRRNFLVPMPPAQVFRLTALIPLLLGAALVPVALSIWILCAPVAIEPVMPVILGACGFGGLFLFQALGLWTSLLAPRAIPLKLMLGNKLSPAANVLMGLGMFVFFGLPLVLDRIGVPVILRYWWMAPLGLLAAAAFYFVTLRAGAGVFARRREIMLATIERGC